MATMPIDDMKTGTPWQEWASWQSHSRSFPKGHGRLKGSKKKKKKEKGKKKRGENKLGFRLISWQLRIFVQLWRNSASFVAKLLTGHWAVSEPQNPSIGEILGISETSINGFWGSGSGNCSVGLPVDRILDWPQDDPESERHGHDAQHQVREGQDHDEVVPGCAHDALAEDGVEDDEVSDDPDENDDAVQDAEQIEGDVGDTLALAELFGKVLDDLADIVSGVVAGIYGMAGI